MRSPIEEPIMVSSEEARELLSPPLGRRIGSRISWAGIVAGVFVAIAVQLFLAALGTWAGFGLADVADFNDLGDVTTGVGLWIAACAIIGAFAGGFVASWLARAWTVGSGLWHGATVWAVTLVTSVLLGAFFNINGILGFGTSPGGINSFFPTAADLAAADMSGTTARYAGWFLLGALLALIGALVGGWLGTRNRGDVAGV